jgi:CheY-like chemotaxis protein
MKILIAEEDPISRRVLEANLLEWGDEVLMIPSTQSLKERMTLFTGPKMRRILKQQ